jgi:tRNA U34 5-methylaminomethyl-2-thiouridine-forming methyltransferase MnmC
MSEKKRFLFTEDGSHTIFLPDLDETYHSTHGAIQESEYVFIRNGLEYAVDRQLETVRIFEVGLGTGLNALLSFLYAKKHKISIEYQTIEAFPLNADEIAKLNYPEMIANESAKDGFRLIHTDVWDQWMDITGFFRFKKIRGKIQECAIENAFDVCYFDAFAPSKQPEMWELPVLGKIAGCLNEHGVFVTYCAKGQLKRDLRALGFEVETLPGPPGKWEMVRGIKK